MKTSCLIEIHPWEQEQVRVETGDVSYYEILTALKQLEQHFAREILKAAAKAVGPDVQKQQKWVDMMIEKHKNGEI